MQEGIQEVNSRCIQCSANNTDANILADNCVASTRSNEISPSLAKYIALVAIAEYPDGKLNKVSYQRRIRDRVVKEKKCGFFFTMFVLPLIISLISGWVIQWFANRKTESYSQMRDHATSLL